MSRRFNFMPSRFATPGHEAESRPERDTGVTAGGQAADNTRTGAPVTGDNHGTDAPVTRDAPMTDAELEAEMERRSVMNSEEVRHRLLMQGLGELRIRGRHSSEPIGIASLNLYFRYHGVPVDQGRAAFAAGQQDRARGVRCMCATCNGQRAYEAEAARVAQGRLH